MAPPVVDCGAIVLTMRQEARLGRLYEVLAVLGHYWLTEHAPLDEGTVFFQLIFRRRLQGLESVWHRGGSIYMFPADILTCARPEPPYSVSKFHESAGWKHHFHADSAAKCAQSYWFSLYRDEQTTYSNANTPTEVSAAAAALPITVNISQMAEDGCSKLLYRLGKREWTFPSKSRI